jgi:hypothetical protein
MGRQRPKKVVFPTGLNLQRNMRTILFFQAVYYLITGLWPLISLSTFEAVTGPKTDDWLVQTVGVLAAVIGVTLMLGTRRPQPHGETITLSLLSAFGFLTVDTVFVFSGVISRIYLVDAAVQVLLIVSLATAAILRNRRAKVTAS